MSKQHFAPITIEDAHFIVKKNNEFICVVLLSQRVNKLNNDGKVVEIEMRTILHELEPGVLENDFQITLSFYPSARIYTILSTYPITTSQEDRILNILDNKERIKQLNKFAKRQVVKYDNNYVLCDGEKQYYRTFFSLACREDEDERAMSDVYDFEKSLTSNNIIFFNNKLDCIGAAIIMGGENPEQRASTFDFEIDIESINPLDILSSVSEIINNPVKVLDELVNNFNLIKIEIVTANDTILISKYTTIVLGLTSSSTGKLHREVSASNIKHYHSQAPVIVNEINYLKTLIFEIYKVLEFNSPEKSLIVRINIDSLINILDNLLSELFLGL